MSDNVLEQISRELDMSLDELAPKRVKKAKKTSKQAPTPPTAAVVRPQEGQGAKRQQAKAAARKEKRAKQRADRRNDAAQTQKTAVPTANQSRKAKAAPKPPQQQKQQQPQQQPQPQQGTPKKARRNKKTAATPIQITFVNNSAGKGRANGARTTQVAGASPPIKKAARSPKKMIAMRIRIENDLAQAAPKPKPKPKPTPKPKAVTLLTNERKVTTGSEKAKKGGAGANSSPLTLSERFKRR